MPNNTRTQPDGTWVANYSPLRSDWEDLERKCFGSWNGDRGGAYCSGGLGFFSFGGQGLRVSTRLAMTYGGAMTGGASAFVIRDTAWPLLKAGHAGRTRSIVQPIKAYNTALPYLWSTRHPYAGVGSVALAARATNGRVLETSDLYIPVDVVDGSTLESVALHFRVASRRKLPPVAMPKFRILRIPLDPLATAVVPLKSTTDGLGFDFLPLRTTADAWYLEGAAQTFTYDCDQNNVIDVSLYSYVAHLVEETATFNVEEPFDGIRVVERKDDVDRAISAGVNSGYEFADDIWNGSTAEVQADQLVFQGVDIYRTLVTDAQDYWDDPTSAPLAEIRRSALNGIWISITGGPWPRAKDADTLEDFTPNWIVRTKYGASFQHVVWQCVYPSNTQRGELRDSTGTANTDPSFITPRIKPAVPYGNIYHSIVPTFTVPDLRFQ